MNYISIKPGISDIFIMREEFQKLDKKQLELSIFSTKNLELPGGSMIRIIGYTYFLKDHAIKVNFYNPYQLPEILKKRVRFIHIHYSPVLDNILRVYSIFPRFFFMLKFIINLFPLIKQLKETDHPIIFHQNFKLGLFFGLNYKKICFYDIHGIIELQAQHNRYSSIIDKVKYFLDLKIERNYFKYGKFFIVSSHRMKEYLLESKNLHANAIIVADEGFLNVLRKPVNEFLKHEIKKDLNIQKDEKVILFAGEFKRSGGVKDLLEAFYLIQKKKSSLKLVLIGKGQDEVYIKKFILDNNLEEKVYLMGVVKYDDLPTYQSIADIIVCPDNRNKYNELVPHIKVFDSLASGKPLVISYFDVLNEIVSAFEGIEFFIAGDVTNLSKKISKIINNYSYYEEKSISNQSKILNFSYKQNSFKFVEQMRLILLNHQSSVIQKGNRIIETI